jgi:hypothetical protein
LPARLQSTYGAAMSESDRHLVGCEPDEPDDALMIAIEDVGRLFARDGSGWQELIAEARRLIVDSRPLAYPHPGKQRGRALRCGRDCPGIDNPQKPDSPAGFSGPHRGPPR